MSRGFSCLSCGVENFKLCGQFLNLITLLLAARAEQPDARVVGSSYINSTKQTKTKIWCTNFSAAISLNTILQNLKLDIFNIQIYILNWTKQKVDRCDCKVI